MQIRWQQGVVDVLVCASSALCYTMVIVQSQLTSDDVNTFVCTITQTPSHTHVHEALPMTRWLPFACRAVGVPPRATVGRAPAIGERPAGAQDVRGRSRRRRRECKCTRSRHVDVNIDVLADVDVDVGLDVDEVVDVDVGVT